MCQAMNVLTFASSGPSFFFSSANSYLSLKTQIMPSLVQALPFPAAFPACQRSFRIPVVTRGYLHRNASPGQGSQGQRHGS